MTESFIIQALVECQEEVISRGERIKALELDLKAAKAVNQPSRDWMDEFSFGTEYFVAHKESTTLEHTANPKCEWQIAVQTLNLKELAEAAYQHLEDCGK
jgi:hypothetical protein